jgi:hypothetical protein
LKLASGLAIKQAIDATSAMVPQLRVWVREIDRDRQRERERDRDRETERDRDTERENERE